MVYPADLLEDLCATAFGTVVFAHSSTINFDLAGLCAEKDEHVYHEMITHVPLFTLPRFT